MKEKKIVACVILGTALVSLISVLVAAFAQSFVSFIEYESYDYGAVYLIGALLGIAFVAVFFANKNHRYAVNLGLAVAVVAYCVISLIALSSDGYVGGSYLSTALTLMVSTALTFAAWYYLTLIKKNEETAPEQTSEKSE